MNHKKEEFLLLLNYPMIHLGLFYRVATHTIMEIANAKGMKSRNKIKSYQLYIFNANIMPKYLG